MNFSFEFLNIHITHLTQIPLINMTLNWHHINICNKIVVFICRKFFGLFDYDRTQSQYPIHNTM